VRIFASARMERRVMRPNIGNSNWYWLAKDRLKYAKKKDVESKPEPIVKKPGKVVVEVVEDMVEDDSSIDEDIDLASSEKITEKKHRSANRKKRK
jgi:hypothetical protein